MNLSANTLFHITPKIEFLESILTNGFAPRYCIEEIGFFTPFTNGSETVAQPMVCFCDIGLASISEHVNKYGFFGLGMTKEWGSSKGISPVTYVYEHSSTADLIRFILWKTFEMKVNDESNQFLGLLQILKNYYKSSKGHMYKDGKFQDKLYNFYDEREWRYVPFGEIEKAASKIPEIRAFLEKEIFDNIDVRENNNSILQEHCSLKFNYKDIKYIFVKTNEDFERLSDFIEQNYLRNQSKSVQRNMIGKIQVMENLMEDI
jgi:hypothetical protein